MESVGSKHCRVLHAEARTDRVCKKKMSADLRVPSMPPNESSNPNPETLHPKP